MGISLFVKQLAFRTSAIFLVKFLGFFVRIPLFRVLGPEGMGMYQMAYSVYGLVLTLLVGGFPTALAIATSKNYDHGWRIFQTLSFIILLVSSVTAASLFYLSDELARVLGDPELDFAIQCLTPAVFIAPMLSLFRGFLQGMDKVGVIAFSEIIEQLVRISVMLLFALLWVHHGMAIMVGGISLGAFAGSIIAFLFLITFYIREQKQFKESSLLLYPFKLLDTHYQSFLNTSLAIAATRIFMPVSDFLDALIVPNRLQNAGLSPSESVALYGEIAGMAVIVAYIPNILTAALTHTMTTKITGDWQKKKMDRFYMRSKNAMRVAWFWGIGSGLFLFFYADEVSRFMFGTEDISKAIRLLSAAPLMGGLREISTSILWVSDRKKEPLIGLVLGILLSVIINYYLISVPGMYYVAIVLGILSIDFIAAGFNLFRFFMYNRKVYFVSLINFMMESVLCGVIIYFSFTLVTKLPFTESLSNLNDFIRMLISCILLVFYLFVRFYKSYFRS